VDKDRDLVALGSNVRRLRTERELTQEELASRAGLSANYVGEIERGMRNPSVRVLFDLARALERPPGALLEGIER
jgi:transcriptional regulator with XRE-family HTH domain